MSSMGNGEWAILRNLLLTIDHSPFTIRRVELVQYKRANHPLDDSKVRDVDKRVKAGLITKITLQTPDFVNSNEA